MKLHLIKARPISQLPWWIRVGLLMTFLAQLLWHVYSPALNAKAQPLPAPMSVDAYRLLSLNEAVPTARYLNLWLQSFDNQAGISLSFNQLDYNMIARWLDTILALDVRGQYPMLVAAHIYGSIHNEQKKRFMMNYVFEKFKQHPNRYWRWLAHAVIVAKHELHDTQLALLYADALASKAKGENVPYWAKDLKIIVLEDMGELQAAKVLVGGLMESGDISDPYELKFLLQKIEVLEQKLMKAQQGVESSTKTLQ